MAAHSLALSTSVTETSQKSMLRGARFVLWSWCYLAALAAFTETIYAKELIVEGTAVIKDGDIGQAREIARERAFGLVAESGVSVINAATESRPGSLIERVSVESSICVDSSRVVGETIADGQLHLKLAVDIRSGGLCLPKCRPAYANKMIVAGIPLEFPQQLERGESSTVAYATSVELSRKIRHRDQIPVEAAETIFPYASPGRLPELLWRPGVPEAPIAEVTRRHRAQYVLAGVYRDFTRSRRFLNEERQIVIEAVIHDGANGAVLASRRFTARAEGDVALRDSPAIGSAAFYATDLGRSWGELIDDVANWATETANCLPFFARILKIERNKILLDAGVEHRIANGDIFRVQTWRDESINTSDGTPIGREKLLGGKFAVTAVYPRFSIAELAETGFNSPPRPGDLLYLQSPRAH